MTRGESGRDGNLQVILRRVLRKILAGALAVAGLAAGLTEPNPTRAPLCMNSQLPDREGTQLVC